MNRTLQLIAGIILAVIGCFVTLHIWPLSVAWSIFIGLITLSTCIELFKKRRFRGFSWLGLVIVLAAGLVVLLRK